MPRLPTAARTLIAIAALALGVVPRLAAAHHPLADEGVAMPTHPSGHAVEQRATGRVTELTVDDRVAGIVYRYMGLELADGTTLSLAGNPGETLKSGMSIDAAGRREGTVLFVDSWQSSPAATERAVQKTGERATARGTLQMLHADHFEAGRSEYLFEIHDAAGATTRLEAGIAIAALKPGMKVSVDGVRTQDGAILLPSRITIEALGRPRVAADTLAKATTVNSVLVILMRYADSPATPFTQAAVQATMGGGAGSGSVAEYFKEASYGQQQMTVTVTPWLGSSSNTPSGCNYTSMGTTADSVAKSNGYTPANYSYIVYVLPSIAGCSWSGLAYVGYPHKAWINGVNQTSVYAHEMGHNFGLLHAASLRCTGAVVGTGCAASEYGDPFDAMGNQRAMHYNAAQKDLLGWFAPSAVKTHGAGTATYTLTPMSVAGGATYAVSVPAAGNRNYWIEYRQPVGFDAPISAFPNRGAIVHVAAPFESICTGCGDDTELLDMTPGTTSFNDSALLAGQTYNDAAYGISINVVAATATALTVGVTKGGTGGVSTNVALASNGGIATASSVNGAQFPVASIINNDRAGLNWGSGGAWADGTYGAFPDWVQVNFAGQKAIDRVVLYTLQDDPVHPVEPSDTMTFSQYGVTNFAVDGWNGASWVRLATVSGNNLVKRTATFTSFTTDRIRVTVTGAMNGFSRITEVEAWGTSVASQSNVALASNGGVPSASSVNGPSFPVASLNDNERAGANWGNGGAWADQTYNAYPDWIQVNFPGSRTIDHIVLYTLQDDPTHPVEPSDTQTFSLYGVTSFNVDGWNGSSWVRLGSVTGNNLVKRGVAFTPYTTDRVRVTVNGALNGFARITELEAWGN